MITPREVGGDLQLLPLTRDYAARHAEMLTMMARDAIPHFDFQPSDLLATGELPSGRIPETQPEYSAVLDNDGEPVGFVTAFERRGKDEPYTRDHVHIDALVVDETYRSHPFESNPLHLGSLLLRECLSNALAKPGYHTAGMQGRPDLFALTAVAYDLRLWRFYYAHGFGQSIESKLRTIRSVEDELPYPHITMFSSREEAELTVAGKHWH